MGRLACPEVAQSLSKGGAAGKGAGLLGRRKRRNSFCLESLGPMVFRLRRAGGDRPEMLRVARFFPRKCFCQKFFRKRPRRKLNPTPNPALDK